MEISSVGQRQGREAAPPGWRGPQRSEDTGQVGQTLDVDRSGHALRAVSRDGSSLLTCLAASDPR